MAVTQNLGWAQSLLIRYWDNLSEKPMFVLIALMIATPRLQKLASQTLEIQVNVEETFKNLHFTFGFKQANRKGIYRHEQAVAFSSYFNYIDQMHLSNLSEACLKEGWDDISEMLEPLIKEKRWRNCVELDTSRLNDALEDDNDFDFAYLWISDRKKEGWLHETTIEALFNWFNLHRNDKALKVISEPLGLSGKRADYIYLGSLLKDVSELSNKQKVLDKLHFDIYSRTLE